MRALRIMELLSALLAGFFLWVFLYHWHHSALGRAREAAGALLIEAPAAANVVGTTRRQGIAAGAVMLALFLLLFLHCFRSSSYNSSFTEDILPGIFLWSALSTAVPTYRKDVPIEVREQGVVRRKQSYENRPGLLVFTPWSEIAGCKWYDELPKHYVHTRFLLLERSIPTGDVDLITAVVGRFVPVFDPDGKLIAGPVSAGEAVSAAKSDESGHRLGLQFNLQSLMLLMVVASCIFSCYGIRYRRLEPQRAAATKLGPFSPQIQYIGDDMWSLDFSGCKNKPTDDDLACLEPIIGLRSLNLSGAPVTDAGLEHLRGLKNLYHVDLTNTRVTTKGAAELQRALPDAYIQPPSTSPSLPAPPPRKPVNSQ
jgi:hypothetical protein